MAHGELDAAVPTPRRVLADGAVRPLLRRLASHTLPFTPVPASADASAVLQSALPHARGAGTHGGFDIHIRLPHPSVAVKHILAWSLNRIDARHVRPWLAFYAVPLALTAAIDTVAGLDGAPLLTQLCVPLAVAAWWWSPHEEFRWTWILPLEAAAFTVGWSMAGAYSLAYWTQKRLLVGTLWAGAAAMIALVAYRDRRGLTR